MQRTRPPRTSLALALGATLSACLLAACGSEVPPSQFVGAAGAGVSVNPDGTVGTDGTVPGATGVDPGAGALPGGGGGAGTGGTSTSGGGGDTSSSGGGETDPGDSPPATQGVKVGSCDGFKNTTGITDDAITIGVIADLSGAVPNVGKTNVDAMNAYVAYFNATTPDGICGRELVLKTYDSGLTAAGSAEASESACKESFATVGSFSAFDSGGADTTEQCGQPEIRGTAVERARQDAATTFAVGTLDTDNFFMQPWVYAKQEFGAEAIQNAGFVYLNAGASGTIVQAIIDGTTDLLGYDWKETIVVDIASTPNWNAYAQQMKAAGVQFIQTNLASYTDDMAAAVKQADYDVVFQADASSYGPEYLEGNEEVMEGTYAFTQTGMLEEAARNPEMATYLTWVDRVGGTPSSGGTQSWAAGKLFTQLALELGGKLNRGSLIGAVKPVKGFDGNKIITPSDVGPKTTGRCATTMQVKNGAFTRVSPFPYTCGPLS